MDRRWSNVEPDHLGAELADLARDLLTDARRASGDDDPPAVVSPELVSLRHFASASGFLLVHPSPDLSFAAACSMPAFISSMAKETSFAV